MRSKPFRQKSWRSCRDGSSLIKRWKAPLPELGKGIGEDIRGFKSAMKEHVDTSDKTIIADHDSSAR
ncbi:MAG TPA: twin-arginine translocase TatA/TatE family subunit [Candidatus Polarisedimenticolia bacterium]|nr:twin-arginine translocase TatA/TatE family subunit [Candidatus Polarisedimenticolia bacterium]